MTEIKKLHITRATVWVNAILTGDALYHDVDQSNPHSTIKPRAMTVHWWADVTGTEWVPGTVILLNDHDHRGPDRFTYHIFDRPAWPVGLFDLVEATKPVRLPEVPCAS